MRLGADRGWSRCADLGVLRPNFGPAAATRLADFRWLSFCTVWLAMRKILLRAGVLAGVVVVCGWMGMVGQAWAQPPRAQREARPRQEIWYHTGYGGGAGVNRPGM